VDRLVREVLPRGARAVNTTEAVPLLRASGAAGGPASVPGRGGSARQVAESAAPPDPHVWLDPRIARRQVETIRAALAAVDPEGAPGYGERAAAFIGRLDALDAAFEAGLRDCARREIVTSHAAFAYLARRYRLTQVAITGLTPGMEPSPSDLAALARFARHHGVTHVFFETLVSPRLAQTLAREVGAASLVLNPLEGLTREEAAAGKGYLAVMEDNLRHLRLALGCR
jgi:zinc transport system substrate-binding protein